MVIASEMINSKTAHPECPEISQISERIVCTVAEDETP